MELAEDYLEFWAAECLGLGTFMKMWFLRLLFLVTRLNSWFFNSTVFIVVL
jgi:hypothetical protein